MSEKQPADLSSGTTAQTSNLDELSGGNLLPEEERQKLTLIKRQVSFFHGPIPSPEELKKYSDIKPELVDKICQMAESAQQHKQSLQMKREEYNAVADKRQSRIIGRGQIFCFVLLMLMLCIGVALLYVEKTIWGSIFSLVSIGSMVALYIKGEFLSRRHHDRSK